MLSNLHIRTTPRTGEHDEGKQEEHAQLSKPSRLQLEDIQVGHSVA